MALSSFSKSKENEKKLCYQIFGGFTWLQTGQPRVIWAPGQVWAPMWAPYKVITDSHDSDKAIRDPMQCNDKTSVVDYY